MESHGGNVELLGIEDGIARIRLEGSCDGCPASSSTLELAIKPALDEAAPDLEGLVVEGAVAGAGSRRRPAPARIELPVVQVAPGAAEPRRRRWFDLDGAPTRLGEGELTAAPRSRASTLIVARVEGNLLAFRDACAGCGGAARRRRARRGHARLPALRAALLPAARRALARRRPAAARAGAAARRRRPLAGGAAGRCGRDERGARRQARRPPPGRAGRRACAGCARPGAATGPPPARPASARGRGALRPLRQAARPPTTATCSTSSSGSILCACESCLALRCGDPELRPTGTRTVWLDDFELSDEIWAAFGIPIGLAFFIDSSASGRDRGPLPEPGRGDRVRARARRLARAADRQPGARWASSPTPRR